MIEGKFVVRRQSAAATELLGGSTFWEFIKNRTPLRGNEKRCRRCALPPQSKERWETTQILLQGFGA